MRRSLGFCFRPRYLGASVATSVVTSLCAGALLAGPISAPVYAAPTVGGDENGPQVQILQPGYQDVLKGKTKILIAVKARKFNPQSVEMFIDDKPATSGPIALGALPSAAYDWDTKLFTDGPHKLTVRITDTQGFRGWAEVNIYINNDRKVDSLPPSLNWQNLSPFQQLSGQAQIQLQAVDNFGVKWIIVSVNSASEPNKKPALRSWLLNRPPYVVNFDTTAVPDGLYQLSAKAWDSFEQEGSADPLSFGIVNSSVNATTVGEMLRGMSQMQDPAPPTSRHSATNFTVAVPDETPRKFGNSGGAAGAYTSKNTGATNSSKPAEVMASSETMSSSPVLAGDSSRGIAQTASPQPVIIKPNGAIPKTQLQPSAPAMIARQTSPQVVAQEVMPKTPPRTKIAANFGANSVSNAEIALPRLSNPILASSVSENSDLTARSEVVPLPNEIAGAVSDDWRQRFARAATPYSEPRILEAAPNGQLSTLPGNALSVSRPASAKVAPEKVAPEEAAHFDVSRAAVPTGEQREFETVASLHPESEKPVWSQENGEEATRVTTGAPLRVEAPADLTPGRISAPATLVARAEIVPEVAPSLSQAISHLASRVAERIAVLPPSETQNSVRSRSSAPEMSAERAVPGESNAQLPQISALPASSAPQFSTPQPVLAQNAAIETPRAGKAALPVAGANSTRVAALPRAAKTAAKGTINAITVSPLEVKTSDAIPAFHVTARATTLRAVAARYGLPAEVVAACNGWSSDKILLGGERVALPQQLKIAYQGVPVQGDAPSMLVGGTGVTAFRFMFEQAGGKLNWDAKKQRVVARKGDSEVVLTIGSKKAKVGDKDVMMELAAFLFEGRTMVPVRFFEEGLHAQVEWDPQTGRLVVAMAN